MSAHELGSTNVYADLEYVEAEEMLVKAELVTAIRQIISARGWTQQQAATVLGIPQPKLSNMLRGQFRGISQSKLMLCLLRLGRDVQIIVGPAREPATPGHIGVMFA